ncbi:hypothetical protein [Flavobacterium sp.]
MHVNAQYTGGNGTENDLYQLKNATDLGPLTQTQSHWNTIDQVDE